MCWISSGARSSRGVRAREWHGKHGEQRQRQQRGGDGAGQEDGQVSVVYDPTGEGAVQTTTALSSPEPSSLFLLLAGVVAAATICLRRDVGNRSRAA